MAIRVMTYEDLENQKNGVKQQVTIDMVDESDRVKSLADSGMSNKEIADKTGLSSQKVASIIKKG